MSWAWDEASSSNIHSNASSRHQESTLQRAHAQHTCGPAFVFATARLRCAYVSLVRRAFTLIELLVVIGIIALLIAILIPSLAQARRTGRTVVCAANLRGSGQGLVLYNNDHKELVVPSYNMTGTTGGAGVPLDGWACILDRDGYMQSGSGSKGNAFYCPDTFDVAGVATGQTGTDPNNPKGWLEWPFERQGSANVSVLIEDRGFFKNIKVAYWINAINPIGGTVAVEQDLHYTGSVGYGPGASGAFVNQTKLAAFVRPSQLIALADGLYAGRQRDNQVGMANSRIGFRHPGRSGAANAAFADGHVALIGGKEFPRALGGSNLPEDVRAENANGKPSIYANPEKTLAP
jgi:prepilin-type N-terminal cleavage/methylation domain-containing protein/prepilin-type processing-associated H-X9-DG protein